MRLLLPTYENTCRTSGPSTFTPAGSYAARLIPGYTTVGMELMDGKCVLKTRAVNFELAKMTSACAVVGKKFTRIPVVKRNITHR